MMPHFDTKVTPLGKHHPNPFGFWESLIQEGWKPPWLTGGSRHDFYATWHLGLCKADRSLLLREDWSDAWIAAAKKNPRWYHLVNRPEPVNTSKFERGKTRSKRMEFGHGKSIQINRMRSGL